MWKSRNVFADVCNDRICLNVKYRHEISLSPQNCTTSKRKTFYITSLSDETKKGQKLLKPSTSGELSKEPFHHCLGEEDRVIPGHTPSLLHVTDRRREFRGKEWKDGIQ